MGTVELLVTLADSRAFDSCANVLLLIRLGVVAIRARKRDLCSRGFMLPNGVAAFASICQVPEASTAQISSELTDFARHGRILTPDHRHSTTL